MAFKDPINPWHPQCPGQGASHHFITNGTKTSPIAFFDPPPATLTASTGVYLLFFKSLTNLIINTSCCA